MNITEKTDKQNYPTFDIIIKSDFVFVFDMILREAILARMKPSRRLWPATLAQACVTSLTRRSTA